MAFIHGGQADVGLVCPNPSDAGSVFARFFASPSGGERVVGTHLWPIRLFGIPTPHDRDTAIQVIREIVVGDQVVLVTRLGGLFVRPPSTLSDRSSGRPEDFTLDDFDLKVQFEEDAALTFNRIICELALAGIVSEPASSVHIAGGGLIDGHALIVSAGGGRELYLERSSYPAITLLRSDWLMFPPADERVLDTAASLAYSNKLAAISPSLPTLVASAYSHYSRRLLSAALNDAWIVTEQIIDLWWQEHLGMRQRDDGTVSRRLQREENVGRRLTRLRDDGKLDDDLYEELDRARERRNDLAHRAVIDLDAAQSCALAMKAAVEKVVGRSVAAPMTSRGVNW